MHGWTTFKTFEHYKYVQNRKQISEQRSLFYGLSMRCSINEPGGPDKHCYHIADSS